jgi:hypothetical protein
MNTGLRAGEFLRHRTLILVAVGGTVAEAGLLTLVAPAAGPVAPQVTTLPVLSAYHDLRWLFSDGQSWPVFAGLALALLAFRSAIDTLLLRLAWPAQGPPRAGRAFVSFLALTAVAWLLLTPAATLALGAAVLPFSWPLLAALPIMIGMALALSHGGIFPSWWRRLPPPRAAGWLLVSVAGATAAAAVMTHLDSAGQRGGYTGTVGVIAVAAAAGLLNARAWYGVAHVAARLEHRPRTGLPARVLSAMPYAPIAAVLVLVLVVGVARLMLTGTIKVPAGSGYAGAPEQAAGTSLSGASAVVPRVSVPKAGAVLVVAGWGSSCCDAADSLRAVTPGVVTWQFSYAGLSRAGEPLRTGSDADDVPLPVLGDRMATQLLALHDRTHGPVDVVAESEGTLGVYAMLDRHPHLPIGAVVLLSPIVEPGQVSYLAGAAGPPVPEDALATLNHLVGGISPYGPAGAAALLNSVGEFGARYFDHLTAAGTGTGSGARLPWLAVIPLADAVTLPSCALPPDVAVVPAFHGGLLGDQGVLTQVSAFLDGRPVAPTLDSLRPEAELISGAAAAWRMPATTPACP